MQVLSFNVAVASSRSELPGGTAAGRPNLTRLGIAVLLLATCRVLGADQPLANTQLLTIEKPLDVAMVEGIDRFARREIKRARADRKAKWSPNYSGPEAYQTSLTDHRRRFAQLIGAIDPRQAASGIEFVASTSQPSLVSDNAAFTVDAVRWPVLDGVTAEGLFLQPKSQPIARVIAIPDADWTPEMIAGLVDCDTQFAGELAAAGCEVLIPTLIDRDHKFSGNETIGRKTNLTHREFIYRQAFELGRHVIGYEVQKVLAAVDQFQLRNQSLQLPIAVYGVSEGGLLAMHSAALDERIDAAVVSGYFDQRDFVWREPIYRNVWRQLSEFGDAEIAGMIAPRYLFIEPSPKIPEVLGPPAASRNIAAPGAIRSPNVDSVVKEIQRAKIHWERMAEWPAGQVKKLDHANAKQAGNPPLSRSVIHNTLEQITGQAIDFDPVTAGKDLRRDFSPTGRQQRQVGELVDYTQRLLRNCDRSREAKFAVLDRSSLQAFQQSSKTMRERVHQELIGKLEVPTMAPNPRSRLILKEEAYTGFEVVLDVYPDVMAAGILLLPSDLGPNERRPVVVCQHGLEGTPMDTIGGPETKGFRAYKSFSVELVKQGYIVYAPQNPYRGKDAFRTLQRKSNPLGRSLFSYIIPQHLVTLRWLAKLPGVDQDRIAFYGLSYGGKTAMRVPPLLPPTENEPGYCLSICSADFNDWVAKNASTDAKFSYMWAPEYEIFEWNMGHVANYAELAMLMTPRPFMVERGHDDGVGIDEWVAWEFAKIRRHYNKLGIGERAQIEFFNGPHTINGKGTYEFLEKHLR